MEGSADGKAENTADGPLSGEFSDPQTLPPQKKKRTAKGVQRADNRSNHAKANVTKSI